MNSGMKPRTSGRGDVTRAMVCAAAMLAVIPLACCAPSPPPGPVATACPTNPYAGTQTAQAELGAAQQANAALNQARYGIGGAAGLGGAAGIGGLLGAAQGLLGAAQQVQMAQQPALPCPARQESPR